MKLGSVLITGGAGYFGKHFAKRLLADNLSERIVIFSRGEHRQAQMLEDLGNDDRLRMMIGDVRDVDRLARAMRGCDVVISAAALKRIEVGAYSADEMARTNVNGAINVVEASRRERVGRVIQLSTDKAWQPISPYGQSKALAESIFLNANSMFGKDGPKYSVLRYGNIWRADGSVVPRWEAIKAKGWNTVPVSDPGCTRFMMRVHEACNFVLQTLVAMPARVETPENLPAYRVADLAQALEMHMDVRGLPWYEKMHEGMRDGLTSDRARRMSVDELRGHLANE